MLRFYSLTALLLLSYSLIGQNLHNDLQKVNTFSADHPIKAFEVEYASYAASGDHDPEEVIRGFYVIDESGNFYTDDQHSTRLKSGHDLVVIDKESMEMVLIKDTINVNILAFANIDSLLEVCDSIKFLAGNQMMRQYHLYLPEGLAVYEEIKLEIDLVQWYVSEMNLYYNTNWGGAVDRPRLQIKLQTTPVTSETQKLLSLSSYVRVAKGKVLPHPKYQNYEVVNLSSR